MASQKSKWTNANASKDQKRPTMRASKQFRGEAMATAAPDEVGVACARSLTEPASEENTVTSDAVFVSLHESDGGKNEVLQMLVLVREGLSLCSYRSCHEAEPATGCSP